MENQNKQKMIDLRNQGLSYGSIAKMFGLSRARVHQICSGYQSTHNLYLKKFILKRDDYSCQWKDRCKDKEIQIENLVIHHIDFNDRNNDPKNLITLCKYCHAKFHAENHIDKRFQKNISSQKNRPTEIKKCLICNKDIKVKFSQRKTHHFCSKECRDASQRLSPEEKLNSYKKHLKKTKEYSKKNNYKYQKEYYQRNKEKIKIKMKKYQKKYYNKYKNKLST